MRQKVRLLEEENVIVDYKPDSREYTISLFQDGHFVEDYNFKNDFRENILHSVIAQIMWERDIAMKQLHDLGHEFGEKIKILD